MSYRIYTTNAIVLKKTDVGEADSLYSFYTEDFGRLELVAQGVRYLKSKLRYNLYGLAVLKISFVSSTSNYWRLVYAKEQDIFGSIRKDTGKIRRAFSFISLLERLVKGQEKDVGLWRAVTNLLSFLDKNLFGEKELHFFEKKAGAAILNLLGYGKDGSEKTLELTHL